ncbi:MAG: tRNA 4-thiouridine(8) synthase ThiI [Erysipelotrichaceae bacterium]|uniref:tRNA uracil 4-sulfurtransferase ThiI n=1 Tax=Floccifex sp. TaxID=2815810 RepID=UPI002A756BA1|nr:tRNA uracil 4-sulfurtransferase ThiI [Floccifex sp.]MDD7281513.1 tRNA 4-thiouridine(8) synthase ThiI [Erysipelotrichaceae bacterium]MDY2957984.1 tRNA uracil 4-sulfurtransferase ThiI [Floccifex sp.]
MAYRYDHILIRYGELSLKGKNRNNFIKQLYDNVRKACSCFPSLEFEKQHDRMYIYLHDEQPEQVCEVVSKVFGISSLSLAVKVQPDIEEIKQACLEILPLNEDKTFKVAARRNDKMFPIVSDQINRIVATAILKNSDWKVDVHNPDFKVVIEVRHDAAYIMTNKIQGAGGYPVGVGGKAMVLLSGGIDSPVASYLMMKRGVRIECIHYASPPYTSQAAQDKVMELARLVSAYQGELLVHVVPFTNLQLAIYQNAPESYAITIMRRMMMRIAQGLAEKRHALAIATGESIGQVASQTLESMNTINAVTCMPIIRPVVCMDKVEIIDLSKKIGTYDTSILPYEDCCTIFTPKNPVTKPRIDKCEKYEANWDFEAMVQQCIEQTETIRVQPQKKEEDLF